jgi:hypothetical protein
MNIAILHFLFFWLSNCHTTKYTTENALQLVGVQGFYQVYMIKINILMVTAAIISLLIHLVD